MFTFPVLYIMTSRTAGIDRNEEITLLSIYVYIPALSSWFHWLSYCDTGMISLSDAKQHKV